MAKILPDKDIKKIIGTILLDANTELINPNGIELRLGKHIHFHSTGEEKDLEQGTYLKVNPGETVSISSIEKVDFSSAAVQKLFPDKMIMGLITPTTTMMREGISLVTTKVDAGFRGNLNWGMRNNSTKNFVIGYGEPIFKLTMFLLDTDESPELPYGERSKDSYQDTAGIMRSTRRVPADIPKAKIVSSSLELIDPKKQLREAGYPFDHIGSELATLDGKFQIVSTDVRMMKDEFNQRTSDLSEKIATETTTLSKKIEENRDRVLEKVEVLFDRKFLKIIGIIIGALPILYGGINYLQGAGLGGNSITFIAVVVGVVILIGTCLLTRKTN